MNGFVVPALARRAHDSRRYDDPIIGLPDEAIETWALAYRLGGWGFAMSFENYLRLVTTVGCNLAELRGENWP